MTRRRSERLLAAGLAALIALFTAWFHDATQPLAAIAVFAGPPLLLLAGVLRGSRTAVFWSGVLGLFWFSHGVMLAYDRPGERALALGEVALSLLVIVAASWPGLHARFGRRDR
ncbi:DUF2069 domain-containing protein [Luteimonas vadosa]|uniref:DUF2069 domain-containing protein n=1 Tax=Luteimonas vadosa TaxID=1165507 RepID=A0ABP9E9S8_9GAMM